MRTGSRSNAARVRWVSKRYRVRLASRLSIVRVPHGHNVLWESAAETIAAVERFLGMGEISHPAELELLSGYIDDSGRARPLL